MNRDGLYYNKPTQEDLPSHYKGVNGTRFGIPSFIYKKHSWGGSVVEFGAVEDHEAALLKLRTSGGVKDSHRQSRAGLPAARGKKLGEGFQPALRRGDAGWRLAI